MSGCPFCAIINGDLEASVIYEDDLVLAIVPFHAPYPESAVVFPKQHIDHFTDLPKELALHVMGVGFDIGNKIMKHYGPERIGMGVHGYGVAHAHFNVFPQNHPFDITLRKLAYCEDGEVKFGFQNFVVPSREKMNAVAETLKADT